MAQHLQINGIDYTSYIVPTVPITLDDSLNLAKELICSVYPKDNLFTLITEGMFVKFYSDSGTVWFTGYVYATPVLAIVALGYSGYTFTAESEDWKFNQLSVGTLPDFVNQAAGDILKSLILSVDSNTALDLTGIPQGPYIELFAINSSWTFANAAEALCNQVGWRWYVLNGKVYFIIQNDLSYPITVDYQSDTFNTTGYDVAASALDVISDVSINGPNEPQDYVTDCFWGDGNTKNIPMSATFFGSSTKSILLNDPFLSSVLDTDNWTITDPNNSLLYTSGLITVAGGAKLGSCTVVAKQSVEMGGELEFSHGLFTISQLSMGIMGGIYSDNSLAQNSCVAGFLFTTNPMTTGIQAVINGQATGSVVISQPNHAYELISYFSMEQLYRSVNQFSSLAGQLGGYSNISNGYVTLVVLDYDLSNSAIAPVQTVIYDALVQNIPAYSLYALFNPQSCYFTYSGGVSITTLPSVRVRQQSGGGNTRVDGVSVVSTTTGYELSLPVAPSTTQGIIASYRSEGVAVAHLVNEGVQGKKVLINASSSIRTSLEAELFAGAVLVNRQQILYQGSYLTNTMALSSSPESGRYIGVTILGFPQFVSIVTDVKITFTDLVNELGTVLSSFGFASVLPTYTYTFASNNLTAVNFNSLPTSIDSYPSYLINSIAGNNASISTSYTPSAGYKVRSATLDAPMADQFLLSGGTFSTFSTSSFSLPRVNRSDCFFIREYDGSGRYSRYSYLLTMGGYPVIPPAPSWSTITVGASVDFLIGLNGTNDVAGVEIIDPDGITVLYNSLYTGPSALSYLLPNTLLQRVWSNYEFYTYNSRNELSAESVTSGGLSAPSAPWIAETSVSGNVATISLTVDPRTDIAHQVIQAIPYSLTPDWTTPLISNEISGQSATLTITFPNAGSWLVRSARADELGYGSYSTAITITTVLPLTDSTPVVPGAISSVDTGTAVDGVGQVFAYVDVFWPANSEIGIIGYIFRYDKGDGNYTYADVPLASSPKIRIQPLPCATEFYFSVASVHSTATSAYNTPVSETTATNNAVTVVPPSTITGIGGFRVIGLEWTASTEADVQSYNIRRYQGTSLPGSWTVIPVALNTSALYVTDSGSSTLNLGIDTSYFYGVSAVNSSGVESVIVASSMITTTAIGTTDIVANTIQGDVILAGSITATQIQAGTIDTTRLSTSALVVGGAGSMPVEVQVEDNTSALVAEVGKMTGSGPWGNQYGGWFKNLGVGGVIASPKLWVDSSGDINMYGGLIYGPNGTAVDMGGNIKFKNVLQVQGVTVNPSIGSSFADLPELGSGNSAMTVTLKGNPVFIALQANFLSQSVGGQLSTATIHTAGVYTDIYGVSVTVYGTGSGGYLILGWSYSIGVGGYYLSSVFISDYGIGYTGYITAVISGGTYSTQATIDMGLPTGVFPYASQPLQLQLLQNGVPVVGPLSFITDTSGQILFNSTLFEMSAQVPAGTYSFQLQAFTSSSYPVYSTIRTFNLLELG